jgi:hypothetical protein
MNCNRLSVNDFLKAGKYSVANLFFNNYRWKYALLCLVMARSIMQMYTSTQKLATVVILVSLRWNLVVII